MRTFASQEKFRWRTPPKRCQWTAGRRDDTKVATSICSLFTSQNGEKNYEVEFAQSLALGCCSHAGWLYDDDDRISPHAIGS